MTAMVLAAGLGTRLRPYTERIAKPALPFLNIPLLYYPVLLLESAGTDTLVFNGHHHPQQIQKLAENIPGFGGKTRFTIEKEKPLGSGGGIWNARKHLKGTGDFFVANGDEVIISHSLDILRDLREAHQKAGAFATILVMRHPEVGSKFGGVWTDSELRVHGFGKTPPAGGPKNLDGFHYVGILLVSDEILNYLPEGESNLLYDGLMGAIKDGHLVQTFPAELLWFETGNITDYLSGISGCLQKEITGIFRSTFNAYFSRFWTDFNSRPSLWQGRGCHHHIERPEGRLLMGDGCDIGNGTSITGTTVLGNNVVVGKDCQLKNCVVIDGVTIQDGVSVQDCIVLPRYG
jgi:mannose-1-phosphate guanylyltransferase